MNQDVLDISYNHLLIQQKRKEKHLTREDVAHQLCLSRYQIDSIEDNLKSYFYSPALKLVSIKKYCEFLGISIDDVLNVKDKIEEDLSLSRNEKVKDAAISEPIEKRMIRETNKSNDLIVSECERYIEANLANRIELKDLVKITQYSERSLQLIFKKRFNLSPIQYIERERLLKSKEMLSKNPSLKVSEAALNVGLNHLGRFSINFKKFFGYSPSQSHQKHDEVKENT